MKRAAALMLLLLLIAPGCHRHSAETPAALASACVKTELYFGLARSDGGTVTDAEWTRFLDEKITPVFAQGLTVLDGYGQSTGRDGALVKERSKVVIAVHAPAREKEAQIKALIEEYKTRFKQESVLWLSAPVDARF